jgi:hypothetical protein
MIKTEIVTINGKEYKKTWNDDGTMIERGGVLYEEAIDPIDSGRVYMWTDQSIPEGAAFELKQPKVSLFRRIWNSLTGKAT